MNHLSKWIKSGLALAIIIFFAACIPKVSMKVKTPINMPLRNFQSVTVHVTTLVPESSEQVSLLEDYVEEFLNKKAIFNRVVPYSAEPKASTDLRLDVKILEITKAGFVSFGPAILEVEVELVDNKTGKNIGACELRRFTSQRTTKGVIIDVAKRIADYLKENL